MVDNTYRETSDPTSTAKEPVSKAEVRDSFTNQMQANTQTSKNNGKAMRGEAQMQATQVPESDWNGQLDDVEGISDAFDRSDVEEDFDNTIADADEPGVVGDMVGVALQADYVATQERAFRARHLTPVRRMIHASGRMSGHGHEAGLYQRGIVGTAEGTMKQAKDQ